MVCYSRRSGYCVMIFALFLSSASACRTTSNTSRTAFVFKVGKGDTAAGLAQKYDTTVAKLLRFNGLKSTRDLYVGQSLRVEPGPHGSVIGEEPVALSRDATTTKERVQDIKKGLPGVTKSDIARPEEFTEEDFPDMEQESRKSSSDDGAAPRPGLLFGAPQAGTRSKGKHGAMRSLKWPVHGRIVSGYGKRGRRFHFGIDIGAPTGAGVMPAAPGQVVFAGRKSGYGYTVIVGHEGYQTLYAHLSTISVAPSEKVGAEAILGEVGDSGNASGPHLHFEVRTAKGQIVNPLHVLPSLQSVASTSGASLL
jgi:murein DD-endopeptidase MepM/ murein hydrolase activator NlpD